MIDFDGTITEVDADFFVASKLLRKNQYDKLSKFFYAYESVQIGILEYFQEYLKLVDVTNPGFEEWVLKTPVRLDLVELILSVNASVPITVISEGLDLYIEPILKKFGLTEIPLVCNRTKNINNHIAIAADPKAVSCKRCLSCKGAFITAIKRSNPSQKTAIIGNGASDLCAAKIADAVFARDSLSHRCNEFGISYIPWSTAKDIQASDIWNEIIKGKK